MHVVEVRHGELVASIARQAGDAGITSAAIVSLVGAVDSFTVSTMPRDDPSKDVLTDYDMPAEMSGAGEIVGGVVHIHAVMAVEGDRAISGHLHRAQVSHWFARAYLQPVDG